MINRHLGLPITFALALAVADSSAKPPLGADELLERGALKDLLPRTRDEPANRQAGGAAMDRVAQSCFNGVWRRC
jgi:hypothetical protein